MNSVLIISPDSLRADAVNLLAVLTSEVSNLGCMQSTTYEKNGTNYAVVSYPEVLIDLSKLENTLVRPVQDTLEIIDMTKAENAASVVVNNTVGPAQITISTFADSEILAEILNYGLIRIEEI